MLGASELKDQTYMRLHISTKGVITTLLVFISILSYSQEKLIDNQATAQTKTLFRNLAELSKMHTLFGHQHATEYGHGWYGDKDRSDVKSVTGSHPAVIGVDLLGFTGRTKEEIKKTKDELRQNVVDTYNRGGVTTVAWHFSNPVSGGGFLLG